MTTKRPFIILLTLAAFGFLIYRIWLWVIKISFDSSVPAPLPWLAGFNFVIWAVVLYWTLYHLSFQITALFKNMKNESGQLQAGQKCPSVVILYLTCDDFMEKCCMSCLGQVYDKNKFRLIICDDSTTDKIKKNIDDFFLSHQNQYKIEIVRRDGNAGFKAGNLNNVITHYVKENWICVVDADQYLPEDYLSKFIQHLPGSDSNIAYIQSANECYVDDNSSCFQRILSCENSLYYFLALPPRNTSGFVPLLGHGAIISRAAWQQIGGFPEIVSEDFAFSMRAINSNFKGVYLKDVISNETFPYDFGCFLVRLKKFSGGSSELMRKEFFQFWGRSASLVEKWDLSLMLLGYIVMPLLTINGFVSAYVSNRLWVEYYPYINPLLPYIYASLFFTTYAMIRSVKREQNSSLQFYFWSTAIYISVMPIASWEFFKGLFIKPTFRTTPKNQAKVKLKVAESIFMVLLGLGALACSKIWFSPFSPYLAGQGVAYLSFPLFHFLCDDTVVGKVSRIIIYLPGIFMIYALFNFWCCAR